MSNYDYEDDDFDTEDTSNDLVKQLRKATKAKDKELSELKAQFESLNKAQRERAIKDALESRGVNSKIASFIPQDIDPTEESVSKWLADPNARPVNRDNNDKAKTDQFVTDVWAILDSAGNLLIKKHHD